MCHGTWHWQFYGGCHGVGAKLKSNILFIEAAFRYTNFVCTPDQPTAEAWPPQQALHDRQSACQTPSASPATEILRMQRLQ